MYDVLYSVQEHGKNFRIIRFVGDMEQQTDYLDYPNRTVATMAKMRMESCEAEPEQPEPKIKQPEPKIKQRVRPSQQRASMSA